MANFISTIFMALIAAACYIYPIPDDFDRYMYEAVVRSKSQSLDTYYPAIRHESMRAEGSSVIDTPAHMKEAEPLYAIRPLYALLIYGLSLTGLSFQHSINLISAVALFCTGFLALVWTKSPIPSLLLMATWQVLYLGRGGTPDGLSTFTILLSLFLLERYQTWALVLLFLGLFIRTDSLLLLLAVLVWLAMRHRLELGVAVASGLTAVVIVLGINHWAHHPGWIVLFRLSFLGGAVPSQVPRTLSIREYITGFSHGAWSIIGQMSLWALLGLITWRITRSHLLIVATAAVIVHFVLYPSPEVRYLLWYCVLVGILFIQMLPAAGIADSGRCSATDLSSITHRPRSDGRFGLRAERNDLAYE